MVAVVVVVVVAAAAVAVLAAAKAAAAAAKRLGGRDHATQWPRLVVRVALTRPVCGIVSRAIKLGVE